MTDIPANTTSKAAMEGASGFFVEVGSFSGALEKQGDHDWIRVELSAGSTYHFYLSTIDRGTSNASPILFLREGDGDFIMSNSAAGTAILTYTVPTAGIYFLEVYTAGGPVTDYSLFATRVPATDKPQTANPDNYTGLANERILGGRGDDILNVGAGVDALGEKAMIKSPAAARSVVLSAALAMTRYRPALAAP